MFSQLELTSKEVSMPLFGREGGTILESWRLKGVASDMNEPAHGSILGVLKLGSRVGGEACVSPFVRPHVAQYLGRSDRREATGKL